MRSSILFSTVSLLAQQASQASAQIDSGSTFGSHAVYAATKIRRGADLELNAGEYLKRLSEEYFASTNPSSPVIAAVSRDLAPAPSSDMAAMLSTGPVNLNPTMSDTAATCMSVLSSAQPTDDSGMAACFNINFFDNSTGQFEANMLLFKLATPSGNWSSLQPGSVNIALSFPGASASAMPKSEQAPKNDQMPMRRSINSRAGPTMLESYTMLGSISAPFNAQLMNVTAMRAALAPNIKLTAVTINNINLTTNMTAPAGAGFASGWFSDADIAEKAAFAAAKANPAPFVLPGVTLGFFPIGLIVTSIWVGLFVGTIGFGTIGRMQWRSAYRAQKPGASGK